MESLGQIYLVLGFLLGCGLIVQLVGLRLYIPRATLLLIVGIVLGPIGISLLPGDATPVLDGMSSIALVMIGFLLGEQFNLSNLRVRGRDTMVVSIVVVVVTVGVVVLGLLLLKTPLEVALLMGAIAASTDPAATLDVMRESKAKGPVSSLLAAVVAIDDLWGLLAFSIILAFVQHADNSIAISLVRELGGAAIIGIGIGLPGALLTGRLRSGEPTLLEALTLVFLCAGLAMYWEVSSLLAAMVMGMVVANVAKHHDRPFHEIENVQAPFLIVFFIVAGASLEPSALQTVGFLGAMYIVLRTAGRYVSGYAGARMSSLPPESHRWVGLTMFPQAGVAVGMALHTVQVNPALGEIILPIVIASTVVFELAGPVITRIALRRAGEIPDRSV